MAEPSSAGDWVEMKLRGLILDPHNNSPVLILREAGGATVLPIWIGVFEAQAIALALEGVELPRPMTHDLLLNTCHALACRVVRVEIHSLTGGTFFARMILEAGERRVEVDARPSDAIAVALRARVPIRAARRVLTDAVSTSRATDSTDEEKIREWLANARPEDLGKYSM